MATAEKVIQASAVQQSNIVSHWIALVFGCSHREISRPFTRQGQTYRSCLDCGARRRFDLENWQDLGGFKYADV